MVYGLGFGVWGLSEFRSESFETSNFEYLD